MKKYALIENGVVVATQQTNRSLPPEWIEIPESAGVGYVEQPDGSFLPPEPAAPETKITRLAFRNRFTLSEKIAVETAAESDAAIRVMLKDQEAATYIDLSRQDTIDGVNYLASQNLITAARAEEVLTAPIQPHEVPKG